MPDCHDNSCDKINEATNAIIEALDTCKDMNVAVTLGILEVAKQYIIREYANSSMQEAINEAILMQMSPEGGVQ